MKYSILFIFLLCPYLVAETEFSVARRLIPHTATDNFGSDVTIDPNGVVTLNNGKTNEEAAVAFWNNMIERFQVMVQNMNQNKNVIKIDYIGLLFADNSQIYFSISKREVKWSGKVPDQATRDFLDAVALSYDYTMGVGE